jgi:uncharacterized protein YkwD
LVRACLWLAIVLVLMAPCPAAGAAAGQSARMVERVNRMRAHHGLPALRTSKSLTRSAGRYARWMLSHDHLGHSATIRAPRRFRRLGETLAWHLGWAPQTASTLKQWSESPPHRAALLSPSFHHIGAGFRRGRVGDSRVTAWVAHLGG